MEGFCHGADSSKCVPRGGAPSAVVDSIRRRDSPKVDPQYGAGPVLPRGIARYGGRKVRQACTCLAALPAETATRTRQ